MSTAAVELRAISKRFDAVVANDGIDLVLARGTVHAVMGENGAGKSTLMSILFGLVRPDSGEIVVDGETRSFQSPLDAIAAGLGMVHQHFRLFDSMTVAENVVFGAEPTRGGRIDRAAAAERVRSLADRYGLDTDPQARVGDLSAGARQRVEILKALHRDARILILDEPTAVLTPQETDELMGIMRQLRDDGTSIVFITHKLREVREVADTITVIRLGKVVAEAEPTATNAELASLMVGRAVELTVSREAPHLRPGGLVVEGLSVTDETGHLVVNDVSFAVQPGEVLAIAGVQGNGQTELTEALIGLQAKVSGSILLDGENLNGRSVKQIIDAGVGFVPEDRKVEGLVGEFSVAENLVLNRSGEAPFFRAATLRRSSLADFAREKIDEFDIRTQSPQTAVGRLSGGNQQKVVLARELSRPLKLFVASQPTRGIDVGSIEFVHKRIVETRDSGVPVIVVSTELDEVSALADRIAVMYRGRIVGIVPGDASRETLGLMMAGESIEGINA